MWRIAGETSWKPSARWLSFGSVCVCVGVTGRPATNHGMGARPSPSFSGLDWKLSLLLFFVVCLGGSERIHLDWCLFAEWDLCLIMSLGWSICLSADLARSCLSIGLLARRHHAARSRQTSRTVGNAENNRQEAGKRGRAHTHTRTHTGLCVSQLIYPAHVCPLVVCLSASQGA